MLLNILSNSHIALDETRFIHYNEGAFWLQGFFVLEERFVPRQYTASFKDRSNASCIRGGGEWYRSIKMKDLHLVCSGLSSYRIYGLLERDFASILPEDFVMYVNKTTLR